MNHETFVYLLKCLDVTERLGYDEHLTFLKVGISKDPRARALSLQAAMPFFLSIHWLSAPMSRRGALMVESATHAIMETAQVKGEWFLTHPALARWAIDRACDLPLGDGREAALERLSDEFSERDRFAARIKNGEIDPGNVIRGPWPR